MNWMIIVWGYIGLLLVGGLMGFLKAKSRASLIASSSIAAILTGLLLFGVSAIPMAVVLFVLAAYFASRYVRSRKLMPGGIFAVISTAAAISVWLLKA